MKRVGAVAVFGLMALGLWACPIYEERAGCFDSYDCPVGAYCGVDGRCHFDSGGPRRCNSPNDCALNQTCGADRYCHPGDCSAPGTGCVAGYVCVERADFGHVCVPEWEADGGAGGGDGDSSDGGDAGSDEDGGSDANPTAVFCGAPADCASGETCGADGRCHEGDCGTHPCINGFVCEQGESGPTCVRGNPQGCASEDDCATGVCIDGLCTDPSFACSDGTQCREGHACVDGRCVARCTSDAGCPAGFGCHDELGVCIEVRAPCAKTADCGDADRVCVNGACVPRCGVGRSCESGSVCVDNGCVPRASIEVACDVEGSSEGCGAGEVCVRHACYRSCEAPNEDACEAEPSFDACKTVTTGSGSYAVCADAGSLGSECDIARGLRCAAGSVCIDGTCRSSG